jgi:hypothetical protein
MNKRVSILLVVLIAALGLVFLYRLLLLEFESGDAYPEFSSYRPDPLGLLVLYEAIDSLSGPAPSRNLVPIEQAMVPDGATLMFAGAAPSPDSVRTLERLEQFVDAGGRLVILFRPDLFENGVIFLDREDETASENEKKDSAKRPRGEGDEEADEDEVELRDEMLDALLPTQDISERWGFDYRIRESLQDEVQAVRETDARLAALPESLAWHSPHGFKDLAAEWQPIYSRAGFPVVIERPWGRGTIVIATDNFSVTNEAMRHDRETSYVAWLAPAVRPVVFEETHLGVVRPTGVMTLMRRYRLVPVLFAAILLVGLYVWRNAASLVPKTADVRNMATVEPGFSTVAGIANLARRSVSRSDALETCWRQFMLIPARRGLGTDAVRTAVARVLSEYRDTPRHRRNLAAAYNKIVNIVSERSPKL